MQKKKIGGVNFIFLRKKGDFSDVFSAFYGQRSVTAAWATRSPCSIFVKNTPGTAGGPGGRDRTLAVKSRKTAEKITFFS